MIAAALGKRVTEPRIDTLLHAPHEKSDFQVRNICIASSFLA